MENKSVEMKRRGVKNVQAMVMDAKKLEFANETFQHVLCGFGIFFLPNYKVAIHEFMRVLKNGYRFSFTTFLRKEDGKFNWLNKLYDKYLPVYEDELDEYQLEDSPEFHTEEGLCKILNQAGFENIQVICEEKIFIYKDEQEWWDKLWTHGAISTLEKISKDMLEDFKAEVFEKLREMKDAKGISHTMFVLYAFGEKS